MNNRAMTRLEIEKREKQILAPYAACSSDSRGRAYPLKEHPMRTAFQRDRDRIVHSTSFRRLEYKTQVFIPHETDHYRTRLTHTIEVAQISRTLARILMLNEDLAEAIALVHDLGHTPFGHSGEDILDQLLKDNGGFNHNHQSLRVVDFLEQRYEEHPGLNLTYEVREGIVKHETSAKLVTDEFNSNEKPTLEAALVDIADEIAYNAHDIDDGLSSGLLTPEELKKLKFWKYMQLDRIVENLPNDKDRYALVRGILDFMATDVAGETIQRLEKYNISTIEEIRFSDEKIVSYSDANNIIVYDLKQFLNESLYKHPELVELSEQAGDILKKIYVSILSDTTLLPKRFQEMLLTEPKEIVIADYIAGMTDRFALKFYDENLFSNSQNN
jgi:dGTPase